DGDDLTLQSFPPRRSSDLDFGQRIADSFSFRFPVSTFRYSCRRVSPGECGLASSDGDPGTNGVISKTRCEARNKDEIRCFASDIDRKSTRLNSSHRTTSYA